MRKFIGLLLIVLPLLPISAQETTQPITLENIQNLQSMATIDFADLGTRFDTGAFILSPTGDTIAFTSGESIFIASTTGDIIGTIQVDFNTEETTRLAAATFVPETRILLTLHTTGEQHFAAYHDFDSDGIQTLNQYELPLNHTPLAVWVSREENADATFLDTYVEVAYPADNPYVAYFRTLADGSWQDTTFEIPYYPGLDPEAVVRMGRVPLPYEVTSSADGFVKLWRVFEPDPLYSADNGTGLPAVFGAINTPPTHLAWRDQASVMLYLLDFQSRENREIDALNGEYAQSFFVTRDASAILAVNLNFEPNIIAWDAATGQRYDLGTYRQCERPQPDITRMSADGTTLVIGCDSGFDVWRVVVD